MKLREVFPNGLLGSNAGLFGVPRFVPAIIGREITKADVLKNPFSRSCVLPLVSMLPVNPGAAQPDR